MRHEHADAADAAGELYGGDQVVHRETRHLFTVQVAALVADAFATAIGTLAAGQLHHLLDAVALGVVDRDRADLLGQCQAVLLGVDNHHLARALGNGGERRHQSDRPAP